MGLSAHRHRQTHTSENSISLADIITVFAMFLLGNVGRRSPPAVDDAGLNTGLTGEASDGVDRSTPEPVSRKLLIY